MMQRKRKLSLKIWTAQNLHSFVSFCITQWATSFLSMRSMEIFFLSKKCFLTVWTVAGRPKNAEKMQKDAVKCVHLYFQGVSKFRLNFQIWLFFKNFITLHTVNLLN